MGEKKGFFSLLAYGVVREVLFDDCRLWGYEIGE